MTDTAMTGEQTAPGAPELRTIHHVALTVRDIEASVCWYVDVFGVTRSYDEPHYPDGPGYGVILSHPQGFNIGLDHHPDNAGEPFSEKRAGLDHVGFLVASRAELETWEAHLRKLGVEHSPITDQEWGSILVLRDPDNIQLELLAFA